MIGDPQRLQYLEAMGLTTWTSRYRFVNAKPTEQVEWDVAPEPEDAAPGQRLHALLETPARPNEVERHQSAIDRAPASAGPSPLSRARALLDGGPSDGQSSDGGAAVSSARPRTDSVGVLAPQEGASAGAVADGVPAADAATPAKASPADPLRFSLSLSVVGGRWWLMLPGERPLSTAGEALLGHMLRSVGIVAQASPLSRLSWPLMDVPASDPLDEAREGIQVFCAGQARRHGLEIGGAIVVGEEVWAPLLNESADDDGGNCHHLPHPDDLLASAKAKRECWPTLQSAGQAWQSGHTSVE